MKRNNRSFRRPNLLGMAAFLNPGCCFTLRMAFVLIATWILLLPMRGSGAGKREFRGVWFPTVTGEYMGMDAATMKKKIRESLDYMQRIGINAVLFQVRPEADAWYQSAFEPWSRFITGRQGENPGWDPMEFVIAECHKRCMEFHAWINPYRVRTNNSVRLASNHIYYRHPEWFVTYGNQTFFNPALQQSRDFICSVVKDMLAKYDIDAIHMDDYFYPYPKPNEEFDDDADFYGDDRGFSSKGDWRRDNVNQLIQQIHETILETAPWVQFGVSPFGIYRNKKSSPSGSRTNGLQNYDDLYADVLLWEKNGWVDYLIPQIYWEIGHPAADYSELLLWWSKNVKHCLLYIGQDVARTVKAPDLHNSSVNQQRAKIESQRSLDNVRGYCLWPAKEVLNNRGSYSSNLQKRYNAHPALPYVVPRLKVGEPRRIRKMKAVWTEDGYMLLWKRPKTKNALNEAVKYGIYRFERKKDIDLDNGDALVAVTDDTFFKLPYADGKKKYIYVVTAIDRLNNESAKTSKKIRL